MAKQQSRVVRNKAWLHAVENGCTVFNLIADLFDLWYANVDSIYAQHWFFLKCPRLQITEHRLLITVYPSE